MNKVENKTTKRFVSIWVPITLIALAAILFLLGYLIGFRITYAPELENSWDAISAVAAWVGVFVSAIGVMASFVAIWYAIQVPKKIADRQDKIALFEKRYKCFQTFEKCNVAYEIIKDGKCTINQLRSLSCYLLGKPHWHDVTKSILVEEILHYEYMIHQMQFLFPEINHEDGKQLYSSLRDFLHSIYEDNDVENSAKKYAETMRTFIDKYAHDMIVSLDL